MKKQKFVIISHDALVYEDLAYLSKKQGFRYLMENGSIIKRVRTVYPSITYCCHTSMITGCYPNKTGVVNNERDILGVPKCEWRWFREENSCKTLFDAAKEAGLTTANVFWPVTGSDPSIDYNIAEYWTQNKEETIEDAFRRAGSSEEVIEKVIRPYAHFLIGNERKHPESDWFIFGCAERMIREFKPDLIAVHPACIDGLRHKTGVFSEEVNQTLDFSDIWVQRIIKAVEDNGDLENTNFIMMSDHGQMNIGRVAMINVEFKRRGLIRVDENENLVDYDVFVKGVGSSAHVFLTNYDKYDEVYGILKELRDTGLYGISEVFTTEEINEKEHLSGNFAFVLETDNYTSFGSHWRGPLIAPKEYTDYRFGAATHGYLPDKGPQPTLIATGPAFRKGVVLDRRPIVDFAPTVAKILGLDLSGADGTPIDEILK